MRERCFTRQAIFPVLRAGSVIVSLAFALTTEFLLAQEDRPSTLPASEQATLEDIPPDPILGRQNKISVWSYSKAFATRFNLPEMEDEGLPKDVWAVEFRVTKGYVGPYECHLNVYLSNHLRILFPGPDTGSRRTLAMGGRLPPGGGFAKSEDRVFHNEWLSAFRIRAALGIAAGTEKGRVETMPYEEYHRSFLDDLAYLSFDLSGCLLVGGEKQEPPFVLWVEKEGGRDYRHWTKLNPQDFYQFPIPDALYERFKSVAKRAAAYTRQYIWQGDSQKPTRAKGD